ncbi:hypothetical protein AOQ84DRAFT_391914, partial [Glonium stellatum]
MAKGFDGLIEYLLQEIALCGEQGASSADFRRFVKQYYALPDQTPAGLTFRSPETAQLTPVLDNKLYEKVWLWLSAHPDVWIGDSKKRRTFTLAEFEAVELSAAERQPEPVKQDKSRTESNSTPNFAVQDKENISEIIVVASNSNAPASQQAPGSPTPDGQQSEPPTSSADRNEHQGVHIDNLDALEPTPAEHGSRSSLGQARPNQGAAAEDAQRTDSSRKQSPVAKSKGRKPFSAPALPPKGPVATGLRIHTNQERIWQAIAGHNVDYKRLPLHEFALLSIIVSQGESGIIQPELTKLSGQDKRSTPHRTDQLAAKGYIEKKSVNIRGFRTSLCTHRKFVGKSNASQHTNENNKDVFIGGTLILDNLIWYLYDLLRDIQIVSLQDLRRKLGIERVKQWQGRALTNAIIRLDSVGFIKRVKAKVKGSENVWLRCIKLLRMPNEDDHQALSFGQKTSQAGPGEGILEEDQDGDEEMRDLDLEADYGDWNMLENDEDEVEEITRIPPQWNLDQPLNNFIFDAIQAAGPRGGNSAGIRDFSMGKFWRRSLETTLAKLTDNWQKSQPPHLRHFTVIRDTAITTEKRYIHYIYRTYGSFQKAVDVGETSWEAVKNEGQSNTAKKGRPSKKAIEQPESNLDEWGFPKLSPKLFHGRNGTSSLKQCQETINREGFRTVWDADLLHRLGHAKKPRRGRPPKQAFPDVDCSLQTPEQIAGRRLAPSQPNAQKYRDAVRAKREANRIRKAAEELAFKELEAAARKRDAQVAGLNDEAQRDDDPRIEIPPKPRKRRVLTEKQKEEMGSLPRKRGRPPKLADANRDGGQNDEPSVTVRIAGGDTLETPIQDSKKRLPRQPRKTATVAPVEDQGVVEIQDNTSLNAGASTPIINHNDALPQMQNGNVETTAVQTPKKKRGRKPKNSPLPAPHSNQQVVEGAHGNVEADSTAFTGESVENDSVLKRGGLEEQSSTPKRARLYLDRPANGQSSGSAELNTEISSPYTPSNREVQAIKSPTQTHASKKPARGLLQMKKTPGGRVRKKTQRAIDAERTIAALTEIEGSGVEPPKPIEVVSTIVESTEEVTASANNIDATPSGVGSTDALPDGVEPNEFENRVQEIIKHYTDRSKPGIYVNPFITRKIGGRGRPRKALMAIFKSSRLHKFDWFGSKPQPHTQLGSARSSPSADNTSLTATDAPDTQEMRPPPVSLKRKAPQPRKHQESPSKKPRLEPEIIDEVISQPEQNLNVPAISTSIGILGSTTPPASAHVPTLQNSELTLSSTETHLPTPLQGNKESYISPYGQESITKKPYRSPYEVLDSAGVTTPPDNIHEPSANLQHQDSATFANGALPSGLAILETAETSELIASATETAPFRPPNGIHAVMYSQETLEPAGQNTENISATPNELVPQEINTDTQMPSQDLNGGDFSEQAHISANRSVHDGNGQEPSAPPEVPTARQGAMNIPDAEIIELPEVKPTPGKKRGVVLGGGSIHLLRNRIILGILESCNGVYPGAHEIQAPFYTTWDKTTRNESTRPDRATLNKAIKGLIGAGKIRKLAFTYQTQGGLTLTKNILTLASINPLSAEVKSLQKRMIEAHPNFYYPPQVNDLLGDLQARGHHRNFTIETEVTVERLYPIIGRLERRIRLSKEEREERRKEASRRAQQKRREKQMSLRDSLQASLRKRKPGRPRIIRLDRLEERNPQTAQPPTTTLGELTFVPWNIDPQHPTLDYNSQMLPSQLLPVVHGGPDGDINASSAVIRALPTQARPDAESDAEEASQADYEDNTGYMNDFEAFQANHLSESDGEGESGQAFAESENLESDDDRSSILESPDGRSVADSDTESEIDEDDEDQEANLNATQLDYSRAMTFENASHVERSNIALGSAASTLQVVRPIEKYSEPIWEVMFAKNLGPRDFDQDYELQHITTLTDPDMRFHRTSGTFSTEFFVERNARHSLWRNDLRKSYRDARPQSLADITSQKFGKYMSMNWYDQRWMRDEEHGKFFSDVHHVMAWEHEYHWLPELEDTQFINHLMPGDHITVEEIGSSHKPIVIEDDTFVGQTGMLSTRREIVSGTQWIHHRGIENAALMAGQRLPAVQIPAVQQSFRIIDSSQNAPSVLVKPGAPPTSIPKKRKRTIGPRKPKARPTPTTPISTSNDPLEILRAPPKRGPKFKQYKTSTSVCHIDDAATKRLLYTVVVVQTLAGGVEQRVSWSIVRKVFRNHPRFDLYTFKSRWRFIQYHFYPALQKLTELFQDAFVHAYETGEVPAIDYESLDTYDWDWVIEWAQRKFKVLPELDELPADRQALEKSYVVEDAPNQSEVHENYFRPLVTSGRREHFLNAYVYALPLHSPKPASSPNASDDEFSLTKSWIQANIATPASRYNPRAAYDKLAQLSEPLIDKVLKTLLKDQVLRHQKVGRELPGRNYDFHSKFIQGFKRILDVSTFWEAVAFKKQLDKAFTPHHPPSETHPPSQHSRADSEPPSFPLSPAAPDGALMALCDLVAHNRVKLVPRLPPINSAFDAPLPRLSVWGFTEGHYKTAGMDRSRTVWDVDIVPTPGYRFGNVLVPTP